VREITKGPEPPSLTEHRFQEHSDYDNYQHKDDLRFTLASEQRGLCCYCMGRIRGNAGAMKIEHWRSQANYPDEQLDYSNLLAACIGGEGQPEQLQYCDRKKQNLALQWNPSNPLHHIETRVRYDPDGTIRADEGTFNDQLNEVLNLNLPWLKNNRKGVLTALLDWWKKNKPVPRERIEREIYYRTGGNGDLSPYCQVAVWWLARKLER
jgi:uncharacterized protein (TIGR02646 family)